MKYSCVGRDARLWIHRTQFNQHGRNSCRGGVRGVRHLEGLGAILRLFDGGSLIEVSSAIYGSI